jgi:uncharacterized protein (TIGR03086 family)
VTDLLTLFERSVDEFGRRVRAIADDQWDSPTPDEGWTVRDLVQHLVSEELWAPPLLAGSTIQEVGDRFDGDLVGDDPKTAWDAAARAAVEAARADAPLSRTVHVSFGDISAEEYLTQLTGDHTIHAWDLARAIGADETINYTTHDFQAEIMRRTGKRGVDVVVEHVGGDVWEKSIRSLTRGGRLVTTGGPAGTEVRWIVPSPDQR